MKKACARLSRAEAIAFSKAMWSDIRDSVVTKAEYTKVNPVPWEYECPLCGWVAQGRRRKGQGQSLDDRLFCKDYERLCPLIRQYWKTCADFGYSYHKLCDDAWFDCIQELK